LDIIICNSIFLAVPSKSLKIGPFLTNETRSSAYYNAQNELINIVTINSSKEWQDYLWATWTDHKSTRKYSPYQQTPNLFLKVRFNPLKYSPDYDPDTMAMFSRTLEEIQSSTEIKLGRPVEYRSITAPQHFIMRSSMSTLMRAAYELKYFASGQSYQVITLHNAARLAYDLDNCKEFGLPAGCDLYDIENFVLVLEYSKRYLAVSFLDIGDYLCIPISGRRFPKNGEEENRGVRHIYQLSK
jgi:hypothetical protein